MCIVIFDLVPIIYLTRHVKAVDFVIVARCTEESVVVVKLHSTGMSNSAVDDSQKIAMDIEGLYESQSFVR